MCRAVCPVLAEELVETAGPRAKVALCEAISDGTLSVTETLLEVLRKCTGCRSCSANCTSGTDPRALSVLVQAKHEELLPKPEPTGSVGNLLLRIAENPEKNVGALTRTRSGGSPRAAYFVGCVEASRLSEVPRNLLEILGKLGVAVDVPEGQVCCGWPQLLQGKFESAKELALANADLFGAYDVVLTSCPHCQVLLSSDYPALFGIDDFAERTSDVFTFLDRAGLLRDLRMSRKMPRTFYSYACRLGRGRVRNMAHVDFLKGQLGESLVLAEDDVCCGAPLELHSPTTARRMLDRTVAEIGRSGCEVVLTGCPFCFLAIESCCGVPTKHFLAEIEVPSIEPGA